MHRLYISSRETSYTRADTRPEFALQNIVGTCTRCNPSPETAYTRDARTLAAVRPERREEQARRQEHEASRGTAAA